MACVVFSRYTTHRLPVLIGAMTETKKGLIGCSTLLRPPWRDAAELIHLEKKYFMSVANGALLLSQESTAAGDG